MARVADAEVKFFWEDRAGVKRWTVSWRAGSGNGFRRIETTSHLDEDGMRKIVDAVAAEMESWLF